MREIWKDGRLREVIRRNGRFVTWWFIIPEEPLFYRVSPEPLFYRVSVGLNFVVSHKYYGALVQEWFETESEAFGAVPRLKRQLIRMVENYVGYPSSGWWFDSMIGYGVQEVFEHEEPYEIIERKD